MRKRCEIERYVVPLTDNITGRHHYGHTTSQTRCTTHQWYWAPGTHTELDGLCPLGRIEEATDLALAKIEAKGKP